MLHVYRLILYVVLYRTIYVMSVSVSMAGQSFFRHALSIPMSCPFRSPYPCIVMPCHVSSPGSPTKQDSHRSIPLGSCSFPQCQSCHVIFRLISFPGSSWASRSSRATGPRWGCSLTGQLLCESACKIWLHYYYYHNHYNTVFGKLLF